MGVGHPIDCSLLSPHYRTPELLLLIYIYIYIKFNYKINNSLKLQPYFFFY